MSVDKMRKQREEEAMRRADREREERRKREELERRRQAEEYERRRWDEMARSKQVDKKQAELISAEARQDALMKQLEEQKYADDQAELTKTKDENS
jgi:hypothetical protein